MVGMHIRNQRNACLYDSHRQEIAPSFPKWTSSCSLTQIIAPKFSTGHWRSMGWVVCHHNGDNSFGPREFEKCQCRNSSERQYLHRAFSKNTITADAMTKQVPFDGHKSSTKLAFADVYTTRTTSTPRRTTTPFSSSLHFTQPSETPHNAFRQP